MERKILVLGAIGAGKSTMLNILSSQSQTPVNRNLFKSSNQMTGFTQKFDSAVTVIQGIGHVALYDSPGLADPNLRIDKWSDLFNESIADAKFDLVVCVIECSQRISTKELQLFRILSQVFTAIGEQNLVFIFNKCPRQHQVNEALQFYQECCKQVNSPSPMPKLSQDRILVLERKGIINQRMSNEEVQAAQQMIVKQLSVDVVNFVIDHLKQIVVQTQPKQADSKKLAALDMDQETRQELSNMRKRQKKQFVKQKKLISKKAKEIERNKSVMKDKELQLKIDIRIKQKEAEEQAVAQQNEKQRLEEENRINEEINQKLREFETQEMQQISSITQQRKPFFDLFDRLESQLRLKILPAKLQWQEQLLRLQAVAKQKVKEKEEAEIRKQEEFDCLLRQNEIARLKEMQRFKGPYSYIARKQAFKSLPYEIKRKKKELKQQALADQEEEINLEEEIKMLKECEPVCSIF